MGKHTQSLEQQVLARMRAAPRGTVFAPADFLSLGARAAVDQVLSRNCRLGRIRKVARGLYDLPRQHPTLGVLSPRPDAIARAVIQRDAARLQAAGGAAAHALGLTEQVPLRQVYLTDGRARQIKVGKSLIVLRKAAPRQLATAGRASGDVIQALRWLRRDQVDDQVIARLRQVLTPAQKAHLLKDLRYAPIWVAHIMRQIAQPEGR